MKILCIFGLLIASAISFCQAPDFGGNSQRDAMKKLSFMVGDWKGGGWADANGQKREFEGNESIGLRCDGTVLSLEGNHFMTIQNRKIPIHVAFGMLRFDDKAKTY
jgi:hypothetical protein